MSGFSGAVRLADVSDFITPAQACVVSTGGGAGGPPLPPGAPLAAVAAAAAARAVPGETSGGVVPGARRAPVKLSDDSAQPSRPPPPPTPVRVTLYDCLACSGCVTSAEAVLMESQGEAELEALLARSAAWREQQGGLGGGGRGGRRLLDSPPPAPLVVLLTSQSAASLAAAVAVGVPVSVAARAVAAALKAAGAVAVLDGGEARAGALVVAATEFCARFAACPRGAAALAAAGLPGAGEAAVRAAADLGLDVAKEARLPLLAGACPGWVCFAEKGAPEAALPHLAAGRSPQALAGALLKRWAATGAPALAGARPTFVTISPCADKKLEALRDEFRVEEGAGGAGGGGGGGGAGGGGSGAPEVECVVTTIEAGRWLGRAAPGWAADAAAAASASLPPLDTLADLVAGTPRPPSAPLLAAGGGGSGGWGAFVFRAAAASLFGVTFQPGDGGLPWVAGRNAHARDLVLRAPDGVPLLRVGLATGFRNIQALIRRGGRGALPPPAGGGGAAPSLLLPPPGAPGPYDYVEIMACPGGCTNGGGQAREASGEAVAAALEAEVGAQAGTSASSSWERVAAEVGEGLVAGALGGGAMPAAALWAGYRARGGEGAGGGVVKANDW